MRKLAKKEHAPEDIIEIPDGLYGRIITSVMPDGVHPLSSRWIFKKGSGIYPLDEMDSEDRSYNRKFYRNRINEEGRYHEQ